MKKSIILLIGMLVAISTSYASDKYTEAMQKAMSELSLAQTPEDFLEVSNAFARIAAVEQSKWIPAYYAAYSTTIFAAMEDNSELKDQYLDKAEEFLKAASSADRQNAEILGLQGFIYLLRIAVDPQNRGQEFSGKSGKVLAKAREMDPDNPRIMYLTAQLISMFDNYSSDIPFYPSWGKNMAIGFRERCH
ncbi:MAG: hypothetical protein P8X57_05865 [Cyclobacteriaceae bacterium]